MPRKIITEIIKGDHQTMEGVYGEAMNTVVGEITEMWASGVEPPGEDARVLNVHLHDEEGNHVGFRFYLVAGEPMVLGKPPVETLGDE
jgi:hypothetical protein